MYFKCTISSGGFENNEKSIENPSGRKSDLKDASYPMMPKFLICFIRIDPRQGAKYHNLLCRLGKDA